METYGIRVIVKKRFASYLSDRQHYTFVNNCTSDLTSIITGVSQGPVLGPI